MNHGGLNLLSVLFRVNTSFRKQNNGKDERDELVFSRNYLNKLNSR